MNHTLMTAELMAATLNSLADSILERHGEGVGLALIGVQRRGADLAHRLCVRMEAKRGRPVPLGSLDITLYRDDWTTKGEKPAVGETSIPFEVDNRTLVLVDDVLFTGRTVRAALEALADYGRPSKVELLVLVDRGHRELPIHADYAGMTLPTAKGDRVDVMIQEIDGEDRVCLVHG